jgi:hypothetical protein
VNGTVDAGSAGAGTAGSRRTIRSRCGVPRGAIALLRAGRAGARLTLAACALACVAWAQPMSWPDFPLDDLRPGTAGFGLTEGPGGVVRFEVEVLARQEGYGLGFPLILVRASGPAIDAGGGVAAGMSGSPVLLPHGEGDALLGAIAYTFPDSPGQLALVTPIAAMRDQTGAAAGAAGLAGLAAAAAAGAVPVATPVLVAGLGDRALAFLQDELLTPAAFPIQGLRGGGAGAVERPTTAGSAVAVAWLLGDVVASVVGTVTAIEDDAVLAFGHPLLGRGGVDWPLLAAEVTAIVPSRRLPFKLANAGDTIIGRVGQDRPAGVAARLGALPDLLPVTLTVASDAGSTTLRFEVVRDPDLWPTLVAVATLEALDRTRARIGEGTATVHWDVAFLTGPALRLSETVVDAVDANTAAARLARAPLALLAGNPFQEPGVAGLSLHVRLEERRRDVEVRRAIVDAVAPVAGGVTPLYLSLQPWRRPGLVRVVDVRWPDDLTGPVEVIVRGAAWPRDPADDDPPDPDDAPLTFDELLAFLRERPGGGDLVVEARAEGGTWRTLTRLGLAGFVTGRATLHLDIEAPAGPANGSDEEGP